MAFLFIRLLVLLSLSEFHSVQSCIFKNRKEPKTIYLQEPQLQQNQVSGRLIAVSQKTRNGEVSVNQRSGSRGSNHGSESKRKLSKTINRVTSLRLKTPSPKRNNKRCQELIQKVKLCKHCKRPMKRPQSCNPFSRTTVTKKNGLQDPSRVPDYSTHLLPARSKHYARLTSRRGALYKPPRSNGMTSGFPHPMHGRYPEYLLQDPEFRRRMKVAGGVVVDALAHPPPPGHRRHHRFGRSEDSSGEQEMDQEDQGSAPDLGQSGDDPGALTNVAQEALNQAATGDCNCCQLLQDAGTGCFKALSDFLRNVCCCGCCSEEGFVNAECLTGCGECLNGCGECCECLGSCLCGILCGLCQDSGAAGLSLDFGGK